MADLVLQRGDDLFLPGEKTGPGEIDAGNSVVGDEGAVAGQILHKELQLSVQFHQDHDNPTPPQSSFAAAFLLFGPFDAISPR